MSLIHSAAATLTREQVQEMDRRAIRDFGVPGIVLMENAGRSAAEHLRGLGVQGPVVICCGKGNNGGDGFVMARHLDVGKIHPAVLLFGDPMDLMGDAKTSFEIIRKSRLNIHSYSAHNFSMVEIKAELANAEWIVDALLGTGLNGPVRAPNADVIDLINASGRKVLAVDLPSGLDCDIGEPLGSTVRADHTITFVAMKRGFQNPASRQWVGECSVADIGVPRVLLDQYLTPAAE